MSKAQTDEAVLGSLGRRLWRWYGRRSARALWPMQFRMLGTLEVVDGDHAVALGGGRERAVLAVLLLHANAVVTRERLIEELWGESAPATVSKNLQTYVWRLRRALAVDGLVVTSAGGYMLRLEVGRDEYDVARFERLLDEGRRALGMDQPERAERALREALALWRGSPLVDFAYEAFAQAEIARLEELRLTAVEERIGADLTLGGHAGLVAQLETLVAAHPLRERLRGQLMLALYRCGRQSEALEAYRDGRERLVDELGLEPGPELQQLEQAILRQSPQLAAPARPVSFRGRGLPALPNRTIGREDELAALAERLRTRSVRLLTLTGPGGVGKTRLALETARAVVGDFPDGAHLVSLSAVQRPEDVPAEIVRTLEIVVLAGEAPEQAPERFLAAKQLLLVMDNFEHMLTAAPFIGRLLSSCHALTVLATSREPLALQAEHRHAVRALAAADASVLFCERARAQSSAFELDDANAEAVAADLPAGRRTAAGHRDRGRSLRAAVPERDRGTPPRRAGRRVPRPARPPAHAASHDRLEPRSSQRG